MKKNVSLALFILFAVFTLAFTVTNFAPPAQASWSTQGTTTYVPGGLPPINDIYKLYGHTYCLYVESNCSVVHPGN